MTAKAVSSLYLNVRDTASRLEVSEGTVRNWADAGILVDRKIPGGRGRRFLASEIDKLAKDRLLPAQSRASGLIPYSQVLDVLDGLGVLCRERRRQRNISMRDAALAARIPHTTLARIEKGGDVKVATATRLIRWLQSE